MCKKLIFFLVFLLIFGVASFAEDADFSDVPSRHWAKDAVDDLINLGITQGYPDGTFRGSNNISRYETATFLAKLSENVAGPTEDIDFAIEKLKRDLRIEIRALRAEIAQLKKKPEGEEDRPISGSYRTRIMFGNLITGSTATPGATAPVGPKVNYRLKTSFSKNLGKGASIKVNVDTMDAGFDGGQSDLATRMLDVEGKMKINLGLDEPVDVKVTAGPGTVVHTEEADASGEYIARSENNVVYERPYSGISFATRFGGLNTSLGYFARKLSTSGEIDVNQIKLGGSWYIPRLFFADEVNISGTIDYLTNTPQASPPGPSDTKITLKTEAMGGKKVKYDFVLGFGQGTDSLMGGFGIGLEDVWNSGTIIRFSYKSVGTNYLYQPDVLDEYLFAGVDNFNRLLVTSSGEGVVDLGLEVIQVLTESINLVSRTDMRLASDNSYGEAVPQAAFTTEIGLIYDIAPNTILEGLYRLETVPSAADKSTDLLQMVLSFAF
ncbi:S-layer homology domain-containing protein [Candidatus Margulisiibacteriota bacterium]